MGYRLVPRDAAAAHYAGGWLLVATAAVAASSLFAILIVMARVPALGALFPGSEFYRVALTLHVNLSQWVWFMAFASLLWALAARRAPGAWDWLALALGAGGALLMAISPALGRANPIMSNYVPVLDSAWFLLGLGMYGAAVLIKGLTALSDWLLATWAQTGASRTAHRRVARADFWQAEEVVRWGLFLAALVVLIALGLLLSTHLAISERFAGHAYFETLFWGAGHVWQFCLGLLMMVAWIWMMPPGVVPATPRRLALILGLAALPALAAPVLRLSLDPASSEYFQAFTWLMQWTSWELPLLLGGMIFFASRRAARPLTPGFSLALLLLVCGLLLGSAINGQTTLVTAHYHGTIGAVTLSFMGLSYVLMPAFGMAAPRRQLTRIQLGLYGYGILLMMTGLAGAGLMGAPRKIAGNVGLEFSVETLSRLVMGLGGTLATAGILMFLVLVLRQLSPNTLLNLAGHD